MVMSSAAALDVGMSNLFHRCCTYRLNSCTSSTEMQTI